MNTPQSMNMEALLAALAADPGEGFQCIVFSKGGKAHIVRNNRTGSLFESLEDLCVYADGCAYTQKKGRKA